MASSARRAIGRQGWTPEAVGRATAALAAIAAVPVPPESTVGAEDKELASKLARWLRYAAEADPEALVDTLGRLGPPCESPQWDELYAWLLRDQTDAKLLARLSERHADPVPHLIALLNDVAPPGVEWDDLGRDDDNAVRAPHRAYGLLFEIGTRESWTWVLSRLDLFDYEAEDAFEEPIGRHSVAIQTAALELWPTTTWTIRADIVLFLYTYHLLDHRFMELLLGVDTQAMPSRDRADYLEALGNCFDRHLLPRIQSLLERALDDLSRRVTTHDKRAVAMAIWEYNKLDAEPPTEVRDRVEALGVRWEPHMLYAEAAHALGIPR
ncbi:MAG: hypothetical protein E6J90_22815 [Deltaproteobacteria bacterium]|nr:MAG: hypothetical protein E6J91_35830 [Deltaproteobacteria bacterium]TMQ17062.1 MAG: hypothetical protein E6J90_22815 [Deltaproteobacteria bacterium]